MGRFTPPELRVGITGHRRLGSANPSDVAAQCTQVLRSLQALSAAGAGPVVAYSALAIGADTLFAEAALALGLPLVGIVPFADYPTDFEGEARTTFEGLLARCRSVERLARKRRTDRAYLHGGTWMVDRCSHLVAVWNGQPAAGVGGTGDVVDYAVRKGRTVVHIPV